jgi:hypothetical protein
MTPESDQLRARCGWESDFPTFSEAEPRVVRISLQGFLADVGDSQIRAWDDSIPKMQVEAGEVVEIDELAPTTTSPPRSCVSAVKQSCRSAYDETCRLRAGAYVVQLRRPSPPSLCSSILSLSR